MNYIKNIRQKIGHDPIFAPAAGCIIIKDDKVLLQKRADDKTWALYGGYLELGETFLKLWKEKLNKYVSELLGKATIDTNTYGRSYGSHGSYSTNDQMAGRELLTPDEVRMLDNQFALLFIRGERPVKDLKYNLKEHPNASRTPIGEAKAYIHGNVDNSTGSISFNLEDIDLTNEKIIDIPITESDYELLSDEELDNYINELEKNN